MEPYQPPFDVFAAKREKREIRLLGTLSGGAILLYILLQNVLVTGLALLGMYQAYTTQPLLQAGVDILLVIVCLLLPFLAANRAMMRVTGIREPLALGAPLSLEATDASCFASRSVASANSITRSPRSLRSVWSVVHSLTASASSEARLTRRYPP